VGEGPSETPSCASSRVAVSRRPIRFAAVARCRAAVGLFWAWPSSFRSSANSSAAFGPLPSDSGGEHSACARHAKCSRDVTPACQSVNGRRPGVSTPGPQVHRQPRRDDGR
jgi:hypothetical protein